eukprot:19329_6
MTALFRRLPCSIAALLTGSVIGRQMHSIRWLWSLQTRLTWTIPPTSPQRHARQKTSATPSFAVWSMCTVRSQMLMHSSFENTAVATTSVLVTFWTTSNTMLFSTRNAATWKTSSSISTSGSRNSRTQ